MSTKTNFKRVALVAVAALGLGVLTSVAPANAAAVLNGEDYEVATTLAANNIGVCAVGTQVGSSSGANSVAENALNTIEMLPTGTLTFTGSSVTALAAAGDTSTWTITGSAVWGGYTAGATTAATTTLDATQKILTNTAVGSTENQPTALIFKPTAVGTVSVKVVDYDASAATSVTIERWTVKVVATCAAGTASAADSTFKLVASGSETSAVSCASATTVDTTDANRAEYLGAIYLRVDLCDANGAAITETDSLLTAEVSSGAVIAEGTATPTVATAFTTDKSTYFVVTQDASYAPWNGTITVKLDGVVMATKTATIVGAPATITVSGIDILNQGAGASAAVDYVIADAKGNPVDVAMTGWDTYAGSVVSLGSSSRTPSNTVSSQLAGTTKGQMNVTCNSVGPNAVAKGLRLKYTNSSLVSIYSAPFDFVCGGAAYFYSASLDKASYVPGDIATLTIKATDAYGNPVYDGDTVGTSSLVPAIAGSNMTAVSAPTYSDTFSGGVKTYKFTVGSTEGSYNMVVDLPEFNSGAKPQAALAVPYKITSTSTGVTNADVLKAIVSLIASINKQIAALQKALLKK